LMLNSREFSPLKISNLTLPVWLGFIMSQRDISYLLAAWRLLFI